MHVLQARGRSGWMASHFMILRVGCRRSASGGKLSCVLKRWGRELMPTVSGVVQHVSS